MTRQLFAPRVSADRDRAWLDKNPTLEDFMRKVVDTRLRPAEPGDVVGFIQRIMAQVAVGMPKNRAVWRAAVEFFAVGPEDGERAARLVVLNYPPLANEMKAARRALRTLQREPWAAADRRALLEARTEVAEASGGS